MFWKKANAYTQPGTNIIPETGKIYYLKELPTAYLTLKWMIACDANNNNRIYDINAISVIDSTYYQKAIIDIESVVTKASNTFVAGASLSAISGTTAVRVQVQDFENIVRGYLIARNGFLEAYNPDTQFTVTPGYITLDGIKVSGPSRTFNTGNDGNGNCTNETFHEVIN